MNDFFKKYFKTSTIHGFSYLIDKYHLIERIFWILALISSLICTILLTIQLITKIQSYPIVIFLSEHQEHVSEMDFPAITVCPGLWLELNENLLYRNDKGERNLRKDEIYFNFKEFLDGNDINLKSEEFREM